MNRISLAAASAVLVIASAAPGLGSQRPTVSAATEARTRYEQIDELSVDVTHAAYNLGEMAKNGRDPQSHLEGLAILRDDVNKIGRELQLLEGERSSLSEWEAKALDQVLPLMQEAAANAEKAIQTYDNARQHLWATDYAEDAARVSKDTDQVAAILGNYLKLASTREKEQRLERRVGEASGY